MLHKKEGCKGHVKKGDTKMLQKIYTIQNLNAISASAIDASFFLLVGNTITFQFAGLSNGLDFTHVSKNLIHYSNQQTEKVMVLPTSRKKEASIADAEMALRFWMV